MKKNVQFLFVMILMCVGIPFTTYAIITGDVLSNVGFEDAVSTESSVTEEEVTAEGVAASLEEISSYWREKNLEITGLDKDYPGEIATEEVLDLMNAANLSISNAEDLMAEEEPALEDALAAIAEAKAAIDEAVATAKANYADAKSLPSGGYCFMTTVGEQTYYLAPANAAKDKGAHASLSPNSSVWILDKKSTGVYTFESVVNDGGESNYLSGVWCDKPVADVYVTENEDGTYAISSLADASYLVAGANGPANLLYVENNGTIENALKWTAIPTSKEFAEGDNVTYLIKCADFNLNNRYRDAWKTTLGEGPAWANPNLAGGAEWNLCAEMYLREFTLSQEITDVPNGYYTMTAQGFYRNQGAAAPVPVFYINDAESAFPAITGSENSMWDASVSFAQGKYTVKLAVKVTDGKIVLGAKSTKQGYWTIWDNFSLIYMGENDADYMAFTNEIPYTELTASIADLTAKKEGAFFMVDAYDEFVQKAVADYEPVIEEGIEDVDSALQADYKAIACAAKKDSLSSVIGAISTNIDEYLKVADSLQTTNAEANSAMTESYNVLVAEWQAAYDKINTEYKEYINSDGSQYNGYLKSLNSIYVEIDALQATIKSYNAAGTSDDNKANFDANTKTISGNIATILSTALNAYEDEVAVANSSEYQEICKLSDEMITIYKDAIVIISDHYAAYHAEAAAKAQTDLFAIYTNIQNVKTEATEKYNAIETSNAEKFAKEELPLASFAAAEYIEALNAIGTDGIAEALNAAEAAAIEENEAKYNEYVEKAGALEADALEVEANAADCNLTEKYAEAIDGVMTDIEALRADIDESMDHAYVEAEKDTFYICVIAGIDSIDAQIAAIKTDIEAIAADVKAAYSAGLLADVKAEAEAAQKVIDAKAELLATYDESVQTKYAGKYDGIAASLKTIVDDAVAADAAGTLTDEAKAEFIASIGAATDKPILGAVMDCDLTGDMFHAWSSSESGATITGNVGCAVNFGIEESTVFGNPSVLPLEYADLCDYKTLVATVKSDAPRFFYNVYEAEDGSKVQPCVNKDSKFLTIKNDTTWIIDLEAIKAEEGYVHLNAIKASAWNTKAIVTKVELKAGANTTIYQQLYAISVPAENEDFYVKDLAAIEAVTAQLADAKAVIEGLGADKKAEETAIDAEIKTVSSVVESYNKAYTLAANDKAVKEAITGIEESIENVLGDVYKADLIAQVEALKLTWNSAYANLETINPEIDLDEVYSMITDAEEGIVEAEEIFNAETYAAESDNLDNIALLFTDYAQWVEDNTIVGDANINGEVTITDAILAVSFALETEEPTSRQFYAADVNANEAITVADAVEIINISLGIENDEAAEANDRQANEDYLIVNNAEVSLVNQKDYVAFQMDVTLPAGAQFNGVTAADRANNIQVTYNQLANGKVRIAGLSTDKTPIAENEGAIISLDITGNGNVSISNVEFVDAQAKAYVLDVVAGEATGIEEINTLIAEGAEIYTANGVKVNALQKGVNIIVLGGKTIKVNVK